MVLWIDSSVTMPSLSFSCCPPPLPLAAPGSLPEKINIWIEKSRETRPIRNVLTVGRVLLLRLGRSGHKLEGGRLQGADAEGVDVDGRVDGAGAGGGVDRTPLGGQVVAVADDAVPASLDVLVDDVGRDGPDLDEAIVLDENRLTGEVAVEDRWITCHMKVAKNRTLTLSEPWFAITECH